MGGLPLVAPRGERTRPTADRVKEALYAALGPHGVAGASVLDLYAGSGALAIEALSRGAVRAVLVDRDVGAVDAIRRNLRSTRVVGRARVQRRTVTSFLDDAPPPEAPFGLVLLDPPYDTSERDIASVLTRLARPGWLTAGATVVVEQAAGAPDLVLPDGWASRWERAYGDTLVRIVGP
jgi:16S rRNA (guanine966-N2)-methyltransferase